MRVENTGKGCRPLFRSRFILVIFHILAEILYEANIAEQENWQPGVFSLATLNYGSLVSTASLQEIFFNDPHFGNHRADLLASVNKASNPDQRFRSYIYISYVYFRPRVSKYKNVIHKMWISLQYFTYLHNLTWTVWPGL